MKASACSSSLTIRVAVGVLGVHDVDLDVRARAERDLALEREPHLVPVLVEHQLRGLARLEGLGVRRLVREDQVGEAGAVERVDALLGDQPAVRVELDRDAVRFGVGHDLRQLRVEHRLAHLVQLHREQRPQPGPLLRDLVDQPEHALLLHEAAPSVHDLVGAPGALEVAGVRDLHEQVVDRVEAAGELAQLGYRGRGREAREVFGRRRGSRSRGGSAAGGGTRSGRTRPGSASEWDRSRPGGRARASGARARRPPAASAARRPCRALPRWRSCRSRRTGGGTRRIGRPSTRPRRRRHRRRDA